MSSHEFVVNIEPSVWVSLAIYRWNCTDNESMLLKESSFYHLLQVLCNLLVENGINANLSYRD